MTNKFKPVKGKKTVVDLSHQAKLSYRQIDTKSKAQVNCNLLSPKLIASLENRSSKTAMKVKQSKINFKSLSWKARLKIYCTILKCY